MVSGSDVPGLSRVEMLRIMARSRSRMLWVRKYATCSARLASVGEFSPL